MFEAFPGAGRLDQRVDINSPLRRVGDGAFRHAFLADDAGQGTRIDAGDGRDVLLSEPGVEMVIGAPVRRRRDRIAEYRACRCLACSCRGFFVIVGIRADIADMRKGEEHDLSGIGRVCQDFLIPCDRGVEAKFTHGDSRGAGTCSEENRSICQCYRTRRWCIVLIFIGHGRISSRPIDVIRISVTI